MIHTVRGFSEANEGEVDVSLDFSCFSYDPTNVGNVIPGSSAFINPAGTSVLVHVLLKPNLKKFGHYLPSM